MSLDKKITDSLEIQIPDYVQEYYPIFVIFVTKYYEWLEQGGNPQEIIQNIKLNADIDTTASSLATKFVNTYAPNLPQTSALDQAVLVKNFRDFYRSKGSNQSFEFFFRAFFNDEITVKLPGDQLFRTSDGDWYVEKTLRVQAVTGNPKTLEHTAVQGTVSFATAIVEHAVQNYGLWDLTIQNRSLSGTFLSSETITATSWDYTNVAAGVSSQVIVQNTAPVNVADGRQRVTHSQLSSDQIIQDSVYWQKFSYVIKTRITLDRWKNSVLEQLHPSGRSIFGEINVDISTSITVAAVATTFAQSNAISTEVKFATSDDFIVQTGYTFDRLANGRTGTSETASVDSVTYDASYAYGGENITFALQNAADNIRSYAETFTFTSITGTVGIAASTGSTATNRDVISYTIPVTSITGTISGAVQPAGGEMVFTGTGTLFAAELPLNNIWRYDAGNDAFGNPVYEYYSSVLTIENLAITGTALLPAQTPVAPNYYYYASGISTNFLSDLLITGGDTSTGISNEINAPRVFPGERTPRVVIDRLNVTGGNLEFLSGTTIISDVNGRFLSQLFPQTNLTVIKPLSNRLIQVSSLPATASSWAITYTETSIATIGSSLTTVSSVGSSRRQESSLATTTDPAMWSRYDIAVPFPIYFLDTSVTRIYVHSTGMIGFASSVAAHGTAATLANTLSSFQPAVPKIYVNPYWGGKLKSVYYQTFGSSPDRNFKVYYDGWYDYPYESDWSAYYANIGNTSNVLTTGVGLTVNTTFTSGNGTNGYWQVTLPWSFNFYSTSYNQIFISHHGRVGIGDWKDGTTSVGGTLTTNVTTTNGVTFASPTIPRIEIVYVADSGQGQSTQNNPRFGNRIYTGVHSGSSLTTSRVFKIRWEGSFYNTAGREMAWEMSFNEAELNAVILHGALSPWQQQFNPASLNLVNLPLWKIGLNGQPYQESKYYSFAANGAYDTSKSIGMGTEASRIIRYIGNRQRWEATFYENSANSITINRQLASFGYGSIPENGKLVEEPKYSTETNNYLYWTDSNIDLIFGSGATPGTYFNTNDTAYTSKAWEFTQGKIAATSAIVSTLTLSNTTSMLFRLANSLATPNDNRTSYQSNVFPWSSTNISLAALLNAVTASGVVARWPQDGYSASAGNVKPEPTCSALAISYVSMVAGTGRFVNSQSLPSDRGGAPASSTATATYPLRGYLFSYGSSASTHGRWLMTAPTYGTLHHIRVNGFVAKVTSAGFVYDLKPLSSGNNLEMWYSFAENPQPPSPGQWPGSVGWSKKPNIWNGASSAASDDGQMFSMSSTYENPTASSWYIDNTGGTSTGGNNFVVGRSGYYSRNQWITSNTNRELDKPTKCTWLIFQSAYTAQTTGADQRTSEYLLTEVSTRAYSTGYFFTGGVYNIVEYDTTTWDAVDDKGFVYIGTSGSVARLRSEIGSGSIIRVTHPADRLGNTIDIDYVVAQDPLARGAVGDYTLVLQSTTSYTNTSFTNIYDGVTPGGYYKGVSATPAYIVETRTVSSILSNTSATVSAPWTSTSARYWGNNLSSSSTSARAFNLIRVNSATSLTLTATAGDTSAAVELATSAVPISADRRFILSGINTNTNLTVSGGGVYANFAGKSATFAKIQSGTAPGFLITGYHNGSQLTANTTWLSIGVPGIDRFGSSKGNVAGTTLKIGTSSFTVVEIYNDTSMLVTGLAITRNFYNTSLVMLFPSYSSNITVTGVSTRFLPQITTATTTSAGFSIEEVTEAGRAPDFRYGFLQIGVTSYSIISIINDTSLVVAGGPVTESVISSAAISYQYRRDYPLPRTIAAPASASFDKAGSTIGVDDTLITQGNSVDFTKFRTLYHNSSYTLSLPATTIILSTSIAITATGNVVLLVTWMKDFTNNAAEGNNKLQIAVTSAGTFRTLFNDEIQRNYKEVAIGESLLYASTFYVNSSNSISSVNTVSHGDTTSTAVWNWIPFNSNRSGVYSRFSTRLETFTNSSIEVTVSVPAGYQWESTTSDFVNITVLGVA